MTINPTFTNEDENPNQIKLSSDNNEKSDHQIDKSGPNEDKIVIEKPQIERKEEKLQTKLIQIVIPFLIAGFGMVGAGILLNEVQQWEVFMNVKEIIVLVPALLGLKGNLDMSLASRLSTQVNLGEVHNRKTITLAILGNSVLKLLQAIVVGFLASFVACLTEYILEKKFTPSHLLTLIASSVTSAAITSVVLGLVVMSIIIISKRIKINPDNVATPMAGSIGDIGTLITLAGIGSFFYSYREQYWIHIIFIVFFIILIPFLIYYSRRNPFVKSTLKHSWSPILTAMLISSISGIILEIAITEFSGIESYQPVINGVGGNLVSIFASRLSTEICRDPTTCGKWAKWAPSTCFSYPYHAFFGKRNPESKTALLLMSLVIPGHLIFFFVIYFLSEAETRPYLTVWLVLFYIAAAFIQVTILFVTCYYLVHVVWRIKLNPDDYCISLLTAIGDICGVSLLYLSFYLVFLTGNDSVKSKQTTIGYAFNETNATTYSMYI